MNNSDELRFFASDELRFDESTNKIVGLAVPYNSLSKDLGGFREVFREGSWTDHLNTNPDMSLLINHDHNLVMGRTTSGTLKIQETSRGIMFECDPPNTSYANDLRESMKRGDISGCSFHFRMVPGKSRHKVTRQKEGFLLHEVLSITRSNEISIVTFPAYPESSAYLRSLVDGYTESFHRRNLAERRLRLLELS